jgi:hypothetical protein
MISVGSVPLYPALSCVVAPSLESRTAWSNLTHELLLNLLLNGFLLGHFLNDVVCGIFVDV